MLSRLSLRRRRQARPESCVTIYRIRVKRNNLTIDHNKRRFEARSLHHIQFGITCRQANASTAPVTTTTTPGARRRISADRPSSWKNSEAAERVGQRQIVGVEGQSPLPPVRAARRKISGIVALPAHAAAPEIDEPSRLQLPTPAYQ